MNDNHEDRRNNLIHKPGDLKLFIFTTFIQKIALFSIILFTFEYYVMLTILSPAQGYLLDRIWMILAYLLFLAVAILAWLNYKELLGQFLITLEAVAVWFIINDNFIRNTKIIVFPSLFVAGWIYIVFITFQALLFLINFLILSILLIKRLIELPKSKLSSKEKLDEIKAFFVNSQASREVLKKRRIISLVAIIMIVISSSGFITMTSPKIKWGMQKIEPQDYQIKFAFWGDHNHNKYSAAQLDSLNRHGVTIASYTTGPLQTDEQRSTFINEMNWWKANYPHVKFLPAVLGIPGGFVWDGSAYGTTELAKQLINMILDNNLTNVVGLSFDWESPREEDLGNITSEPNRERHEESIKIWEEFFQWKEQIAPDLVMQNINYVSMDKDVQDGDFDLHLIHRYNTYEVPYWDEYAPMIYRCGYNGERPFGGYTTYDASAEGDSTYEFYLNIKEHVKGVEKITGDPSKAGAYVGITNCSCYGRDVNVVENGIDMGTGLDNLIRDIKICKAFHMAQVTIFILDTVIENGYSMGGVFDSYGDDFLDVLNESVNGVNSTQPFEIPKIPISSTGILETDNLRDYNIDLMYNTNSPYIFYPIALLYAVIIGLFAIKEFKKEFVENKNGKKDKKR